MVLGSSSLRKGCGCATVFCGSCLRWTRWRLGRERLIMCVFHHRRQCCSTTIQKMNVWIVLNIRACAISTTHTHTHTHIHTYTHTHTHTHTNIHIYNHARTHRKRKAEKYSSSHIHVAIVHPLANVCSCLHVCAYACMCVHRVASRASPAVPCLDMRASTPLRA